jgi:hypothetical protein
MSIRVGKEAQRVRMAQTQIAIQLWELKEKHNLTDIEMLQAVSEWESSQLKAMLRAERHPDDPNKYADEE